MAVANRPLKRRRRTAQRGKPMTQSQRWGKVVTTMAPTPNGDISTSQIWSEAPAEEVELAEAVLKLDDEKLVEAVEQVATDAEI